MWFAGLAACGILVPLPGIEPEFPALEGGILVCFGCAGSLLLCGFFSSCSEQRLLSSCCAWAVVEHGLQSCQASAVVAPGLESTGSMWHTSLVAPGHVGSSQTRD